MPRYLTHETLNSPFAPKTNASLWDIERYFATTPKREFSSNLISFRRLGSLELFLQQETGVDQDSVLAYLSDGRRLMSENVRELAGAHDQVRASAGSHHPISLKVFRFILQTIYVYNKRYLDIDFDHVVQELHVDPPLDPPIEGERTAAVPSIPLNPSTKRPSMPLPHSDLPNSRQRTSGLRMFIRNT